MRHGRFITTALVATAAMAIGPAWASAAPSPLMDDSADRLRGGAGAQTGTWAVEPGPGPPEGAEWPRTSTPASRRAGGTAGRRSAGAADGRERDRRRRPADRRRRALQRHQRDAELQPRRRRSSSVQRSATTSTSTSASATRSTQGRGPCSAPLPRASKARGSSPAPRGHRAVVDTALSPSTCRSPHVYRIEWTAMDVKFYVDGALLATHATSIAGPMRPSSVTSTPRPRMWSRSTG